MGVIIAISIIMLFGSITVYGILNTGRKRYDTLNLQTEKQKMKSDMDFVVATLLLLLTIFAIPVILLLIAFFFL